MVLILFIRGFLPFTAHAFAGTDGVVSATDTRSFDGDALGGAARGAENDAAWSPHLRGSAVSVDFGGEVRSERSVAPQTELGFVESVDLHADLNDILKNFLATIANGMNSAETLVMSNHWRTLASLTSNWVEFSQHDLPRITVQTEQLLRRLLASRRSNTHSL